MPAGRQFQWQLQPLELAIIGKDVTSDLLAIKMNGHFLPRECGLSLDDQLIRAY
jgi:hypothetical protein